MLVSKQVVLADKFYEDEKELSRDLLRCVNREVRALSDAGCKFIQIDEPLIAREPEKAMDYGIDHLKLCFEVNLHQSHLRVVGPIALRFVEIMHWANFSKAELSTSTVTSRFAKVWSTEPRTPFSNILLSTKCNQQGVGDHVQKVIHLCCGYPNYLDQTDYLKADPEAYQMTAEKLDDSGFDMSMSFFS